MTELAQERARSAEGNISLPILSLSVSQVSMSDIDDLDSIEPTRQASQDILEEQQPASVAQFTALQTHPQVSSDDAILDDFDYNDDDFEDLELEEENASEAICGQEPGSFPMDQS